MLLFLLACAHDPAEPTPAPTPPPVAEKAPAAAPVVLGEADAAGNPTVLDQPASDAKSLYAGCLARVEGKQEDGECTTAADCQPAGCSKEMCVSAKTAANVMTACDVQPCFAVLDQCGCVEGHCTWSLKDGA